jgi:hypothetical protein
MLTTEQVTAIRGIRANYLKRAVRVDHRPEIPMTLIHTPDGKWIVYPDGRITKVRH